MATKARGLSVLAVVAMAGASACASGGYIDRGGNYGSYGTYSGYRGDAEQVAHQKGVPRGQRSRREGRAPRPFVFVRSSR
jgi:hypothetical protein